MKKTLLIAVLAIAVATTAIAAPSRPALSLPISGTFADAAGGQGTFSGTFKLMSFAAQGDTLVAHGFVMGTLTSSTGVVLGSLTRSATLPVEASTVTTSDSGIAASSVHAMATCPILHLDLGPLDLDLLGLTVHLNQVVLDIAAESGAGNLLGNLLCAVTGLLDGVGSLLQIADLLNRILDILSGILG